MEVNMGGETEICQQDIFQMTEKPKVPAEFHVPNMLPLAYVKKVWIKRFGEPKTANFIVFRNGKSDRITTTNGISGIENFLVVVRYKNCKSIADIWNKQIFEALTLNTEFILLLVQCWFKLSGQNEQIKKVQTSFSQIGLRLDKKWREQNMLRTSLELLCCKLSANYRPKIFPKKGHF